MEASNSGHEESAGSAPANDTPVAFQYDNSLFSNTGIGDEVSEFACDDQLEGDHGVPIRSDNVDVPKVDVVIEREHHSLVGDGATFSQWHAEGSRTGQEEGVAFVGSASGSSEHKTRPISPVRCCYTPWQHSCTGMRSGQRRKEVYAEHPSTGGAQ